MAKVKAKEAAKETGKKGTAEDKAAKRKARMEALKNRPAEQRPNSKQIDIIDLGAAGKIEVFGYPVRKTGTLTTAVAYGPKGEIISVSQTLVPGTKVKTKKGHGYLQPGVAGVGKGKDNEDEETEEVEETAAAPEKKSKKKSKKED